MIIMNKKKWSSLLAALLLTCGGFAAQPKTIYSDFLEKEFTSSSGQKLPYRILYPENFDASKKYPLVLFLHGAGERGTDNNAQLKHGGAMFTNPINRQKYPCIAIFPQCPSELWWAGRINSPQETEAGKAAKELLDNFLSDKNVDLKRIYIMGISMGGRATFYMIENFPEIFAAAIPICGWPDAAKLHNAAGKVKVRIFHGDADPVVPVEGSRQAYTILKEAKGKVEYIEYPAVEHNSWDYAFREKDFFSWLFSQSK